MIDPNDYRTEIAVPEPVSPVKPFKVAAQWAVGGNRRLTVRAVWPDRLRELVDLAERSDQPHGFKVEIRYGAAGELDVHMDGVGLAVFLAKLDEVDDEVWAE